MFFELLRHHKRKIAAFALVLLPLVLIATGGRAEVGEVDSTPTGRWVRSAMAVGQLGAYRSLGWIGGIWDRLTAGDLAEENARLEAEVARLREEKSRLIGVLQENARLRELVGFQRQHPEFELVAARIVGRDVTPYFRVLKVRLKADQRLEPKMPVVVAQGVVGQVHEVYGEFADVIIVADPRSRIDAVNQRNRAPGVIQGLGHEHDYEAKISYLSQRDEVRPGDVMVTGGMGGVFPPELVIGTVREVEQGPRGLFQKARLEPAVDFSRLREVFVIVGRK